MRSTGAFPVRVPARQIALGELSISAAADVSQLGGWHVAFNLYPVVADGYCDGHRTRAGRSTSGKAIYSVHIRFEVLRRL